MAGLCGLTQSPADLIEYASYKETCQSNPRGLVIQLFVRHPQSTVHSFPNSLFEAEWLQDYTFTAAHALGESVYARIQKTIPWPVELLPIAQLWLTFYEMFDR